LEELSNVDTGIHEEEAVEIDATFGFVNRDLAPEEEEEEWWKGMSRLEKKEACKRATNHDSDSDEWDDSSEDPSEANSEEEPRDDLPEAEPNNVNSKNNNRNFFCKS